MSTPLHEARRTLNAARLLARRGFYDDAVSRAYYAIFYAAREAIRAKGSDPKTHTGTASEFGRLYVQTGQVPSSAAKDLRRLASKRADADYEDVRLTVEEATAAIRSAEHFIAAVGAALDVRPPSSPTAGMTDDQKRDLVAQLTREMNAAAETLDFETAAGRRDAIAQIEADLAA